MIYTMCFVKTSVSWDNFTCDIVAEFYWKIIDVRQHILSFDWGCKYTIIIPPLQKKVICIK